LALTLNEIASGDEKSVICGTIMRTLPNWFGNEAAIAGYARDVRDMPFFAAFVDAGEAIVFDYGDAIGFAALKIHNEYTAEVCVMGVLQSYHRQGVGKMLIERCVEECRRAGRLFLTVKTLDESSGSRSYAKTRLFYHAMGFRPLEVFPLYWDADNPCLLMAMYLG